MNHRGARRAQLLGVIISVALTFASLCASANADTPTASFSFSPAAPLAGQTVTFNASVSGDPSGSPFTYEWAFGDGDSQSTVSATTTHVFSHFGTFTVTLKVVDSHGAASAPVSKTVVVTSVEKGPAAHFSVKPKSPAAGQTAVFNGSGSHDDDGDSIASYRWTFGDGGSQTTSTPGTSHAYAFKGKYTATLTVVDSRGTVSGPVKHSIRVKSPPSYHVPSPLAAHFTFRPSRPAKGQVVFFDGSGSTGGGHKVKRYLWSFGDGATAVTRSAFAEHVYRRTGRRTVQLIVQTSKTTLSAPARAMLQVVAPGHRHKRLLSGLHARVCIHHSKRCRTAGLRISFDLSRSASVTLTVRRRRHNHTLTRVVVHGRGGRNAFTIKFSGRRGARYVLRAKPAGGRSVTDRFVWRG